jgi:hypothetical protein
MVWLLGEKKGGPSEEGTTEERLADNDGRSAHGQEG